MPAKKWHFCALAEKNHRIGTVTGETAALAELCVEQFFLQGRTREDVKKDGLFVPELILLTPSESAPNLSMQLLISKG